MGGWLPAREGRGFSTELAVVTRGPVVFRNTSVADDQELSSMVRDHESQVWFEIMNNLESEKPVHAGEAPFRWLVKDVDSSTTNYKGQAGNDS